MTQNVYMASMSLFIPLDSLRKNYIKLRKKKKLWMFHSYIILMPDVHIGR